MNRIFYRINSLLVLILFIALFSNCGEDPTPSLFDPDAPQGATPQIAEIIPAGSTLSGIGQVTIKGQNFSTVPAENFVFFNDVRAEVVSASTTELTVKTPILVDAIVEATETGSSLKANNLRIVETILVSTTRLIVNKTAWQNTWKREKIENLAMLLKGAIQAEGRVGLKMNVSKKDVEKVVKLLPAMQNPTISPLHDPNWVALEIIVEEKTVRELIPRLIREGAKDIIEYPLNKVISE